MGLRRRAQLKSGAPNFGRQRDERTVNSCQTTAEVVSGCAQALHALMDSTAALTCSLAQESICIEPHNVVVIKQLCDAGNPGGEDYAEGSGAKRQALAHCPLCAARAGGHPAPGRLLPPPCPPNLEA